MIGTYADVAVAMLIAVAPIAGSIAFALFISKLGGSDA